MSICSKTKISLSVPVEIKEESLDEYNSSSGYYNDICYTTTSDNGTDISLKDRKNEYSNKALCQDDCDLVNYDYGIKKSNCSCDVKQSSFSFADMKIDKEKLLKNFVDIKSISNINILKCKAKLFSKKGLKSNIGFYIISLNLILSFIYVIIFYCKQYYAIKTKINDIEFGIKHTSKSKEEGSKKKNKKKNKKGNNNKQNSLINNNDNRNINIIKNNNRNIFFGVQNNNKHNNKNNSIIGENNTFKINVKNINKNNIISNKRRNKKNKKESTSKRTINTQNYVNNEQIEKEKARKIMEYIAEEKNQLSYNLALLYDNRTYCQYYISLLRTKHSFFFSFCGVDDYNSKIIKINIFFVGFAIYYTIDALFFNDDSMNKIYKNKGKFKLEYELPKIAYSTLISTVLNTILKYLALSNDSIIEFKQSKSAVNIDKKKTDLENKLVIKFVLYFIVNFVFLSFFWYYISMFGAIYRNTQLHLLKDTLISFGLSLIYPLFIYLLPGLFRIPALSDKKKSSECLYKFSKLLQFF